MPSPEEEKVMEKSAKERMKIYGCTYGIVKSIIENWMVNIGKNGNIGFYLSEYEWKNNIERMYP